MKIENLDFFWKSIFIDFQLKISPKFWDFFVSKMSTLRCSNFLLETNFISRSKIKIEKIKRERVFLCEFRDKRDARPPTQKNLLGTRLNLHLQIASTDSVSAPTYSRRSREWRAPYSMRIAGRIRKNLRHSQIFRVFLVPGHWPPYSHHQTKVI